MIFRQGSTRQARRALARGSEHEALDYKRYVDLSDKGAVLELVGHRRVLRLRWLPGDRRRRRGPADGDGQRGEALLFDESRLRAKVKRYLPEPLTIRTARHELDGALLVLVYIGAHPDGFVIVSADGQTDKVVFRRGDVFVRHGTASERWEPHDFRQIKEALIKSQVGVPELVPAPPSTHRIDEPRLVRTGSGARLYQRLFIEIENVWPANARVPRSFRCGSANTPVGLVTVPAYGPAM